MAIKNPKIMLDPGHDKAQYNQGAAPGYWEGERMWRLCRILRPKLEARGFIVGTTKTKCDQAVEVTARGRKAKGYNLLISLHTDACADPKVDRPTGIYLVDDDCGPIDEESKELAKLLSATAAATIGTRYRAQQYSRRSSNDRDHDGKVNDDYYGVLYGAHQVGVPAVILENSFHTNARAAKWLLDDGNLQKLANALANALAEHYGVARTAITMETLKKGDRGGQVEALQMILMGSGFDCGQWGADGIFGTATEAALKKYQTERKIPATGVADGATWTAMLGQNN